MKSDLVLSSKNTLAGRYTRDNQLRERANFFPVLPTAGFGAGNELGNTRQVVVTDTHVFKPTFLNEARVAGLTNLEGHRSVGGMRASLYNAMPLEGVEALVGFMKDFERRYG